MNLSIVIPVYNAEQYIDTCMNSILSEIPNQTDVEILLLDDGSQDGSLRRLQELKEQYPCVRVFSHTNHGVSYTRNCGIRHATGSMIMFVDADDAMLPGWYASVNETLALGYDVVYFGRECKEALVSKACVIDNIFGLPQRQKVGQIATPWSKIYRRSFLLEHHIFFDEHIINGEDALFNLRVIASAHKYSFCCKSVYTYRIHSGSATRRYNSKFFESNIRYLEESEKVLDELAEISLDQKSEYLGYSLYYSVYLFVYLVCSLHDRKAKYNAMKLLQMEKMQKLYERFAQYRGNKLHRLFVLMAKYRMNSLALLIMQCIRAVRKKTQVSEFWRSI